MSYSFATGGDGWVMVPCMTVFLAEVEQCVKDGLLDVTNLGQIGDARHQAEPTSRHNPAKAPDGSWYVCATDFGGTDYARLADFHQALYKAGDPRVSNHGFCQWGDGYGLRWYDGGREYTGRDVGHCHFDVTMAFPQLSANWWVDSLASTAPWGLADYLRTGQLTGHTTDSGAATPITSEEDDMPYTEQQLRSFMHEEARGALAEMAAPIDPTTGKEGLLYGRIRGAVTMTLIGLFSGPGKTLFDRMRQAVGMVTTPQNTAVLQQLDTAASTAAAQVEASLPGAEV